MHTKGDGRMLNVTLRDQMYNKEICRRTIVTDFMKPVAHLKWEWTDHVSREHPV